MTDTEHKIAGMGWRPDLPDARDEEYAFRKIVAPRITPLPPAADCLAKLLPEPFDQGQLGSCTANAISGMVCAVFGMPARSRLAIYYYERKMEGTVRQDAGAYIRDGLKVCGKQGAGDEALWPYVESMFTKAPAAAERADAKKHRCLSYHAVTTRQDFRECLADKFPFVIGFTVYDAFEGADVARHGVLNLPAKGEKPIGGHAILVYGYDTNFRASEWGKAAIAAGVNVPNDVYLVRNSWSAAWGHEGNFAVDAAYFENTNLSDDGWTLRPA